MGMDQAAGLRQWASSMTPAPDDACPTHVAEALMELAASEPASTRPDPSPAASGAAASYAEPSRPKATPAPASSPTRSTTTMTLMVLGLPGTGERQAARVSELLQAWAEEGRGWVGEPSAWRVVPLGVESAHLPVLLTQQPRWALWVGSDAEAFRRAYRVLKRIAERGGPSRLLAVHPPDVGRKGLLDNLQRAAASYLGIDLLVLAR